MSVKHDIEEKVENAIVSLIDAQAGLSTDIEVLPSFDDTDVDDDQVIVGTTQAVDMFPDADATGYVECSIDIIIRTHAETTSDGTSRREYHREVKAKVIDVLYSDSFITDLNAQGVADFTAHILTIGPRKRTVEDNSIITIQSIELSCVPTTV
ncbi:hypothetical protein N9204_00410 [bacterium]|nr:hypothetical protein [bacterium]